MKKGSISYVLILHTATSSCSSLPIVASTQPTPPPTTPPPTTNQQTQEPASASSSDPVTDVETEASEITTSISTGFESIPSQTTGND